MIEAILFFLSDYITIGALAGPIVPKEQSFPMAYEAIDCE
jgi:hypothetical protein